jgi:dCTP deaminase
MTVLSAQSIRARCMSEGEIAAAYFPVVSMIRPFTDRRVDSMSGMSYGLSSCSYDVRLDGEVVGVDASVPRTLFEEHTAFWLPPQTMILGATIELFALPVDLKMTVHDKSSNVRRGLTVQNTLCDPGWRGFLTLEIANHSRQPVPLRKGMPIAQVVFELLDAPTEQPYRGKYLDQERGPQESRREGAT